MSPLREDAALRIAAIPPVVCHHHRHLFARLAGGEAGMSALNGNGRGTWRRVSPSHPCAICERADWCGYTEDGLRARCMRNASHHVYGSGQETVGDDGATGWTYRLGPDPGEWEEPQFGLADGRGKLADPDTLHRVYSELLRHLPLTDRHAGDLRRRGLSDEQISGRGYRTLGKGRATALRELIRAGLERHLPLIPGCFVQEQEEGKRYWTLAGRGGLVVPVRDVQGRIVALLVRADEPGKGGKYTYLSSKRRGGAGPGSPTHFPLYDGDRGRLRVTEGGLKADVATALSGTFTLGLPGVAVWRRVAEVLAELRAKTAVLAFDADARTNPTVAQALLRLAEDLRDHGFAAELELWHAADGKGIDDLLAAGKTPRLVTGDAVLPVVRELLAAARGTGPEGGAAAVQEERHEEDDDPHRLARLFRDQHNGRDGLALRYWREEFHLHDGAAYRPLPEKEIRAHLCETIKCEFDRLARLAYQTWEARGGATQEGKDAIPPTALQVTTRKVADAYQALASMVLLASAVEAPAWLDGDDTAARFPADELLVCRNAAVHLPSFAVGKPYQCRPTPRLFTLNALDYLFDQKAPRPAAWLDFLGRLWPDDDEAVRTLREWAGYLLLPDTRQQKILMIVGPKRSGKGTIARVLRALVGIANTASPTLAGLGGNFGLQPLLGKTLAVISDARLSGRTDVAAVVERLLSISGEDAQTVDRKHMAHVTANLPVRFMVLTNELPRLQDASGALVGRLILLRQTRSWYGQEDTTLTDRLMAELPGILLWAIDGWKRLRERGHFVQPESAQELVTDMEDLTSPVGAFVRECCEVGPACEVHVQELFNAWKRWCEEKGRKDHGNEQTFGRDLRAALPSINVRRPRKGEEKRPRVYLGISVRVDVAAILDDIPA
jgi:putative DNA primase/helicase